MIQEARTAINPIILDLPAGMVEKGEEPEVAAIREFEEETGYRANKVKLLREYYASVGYSDEKLSIYLAQDIIKTEQHLGETEEIKVVGIPIEEVKKMLDKNTIKTASANIALLHYFLYQKK